MTPEFPQAPSQSSDLASNPQRAPKRRDLPDIVATQRHFGRWAGAAVLLLLMFALVQGLAKNPNIDYAAIGQFLFSPAILEGLRTTLILGVLAQLLGLALGVVIALCRLSHNPVFSAVGWLYVWIFRGTPLLVQILVLGNLALFFERIEIGIPFTDIVIASWDTNTVLTAFGASLLALGLHEAAFSAEVVRSGTQSIDHGQTEAAKALGMSRTLAMRKIILPQALRVIVPPTGNNFINLLKATSLVAVIAGGDLLTQAQNISAANLKTIELLLVATIWYLLVTSVASIGQAFLERRLGRGTRRSPERQNIALFKLFTRRSA